MLAKNNTKTKPNTTRTMPNRAGKQQKIQPRKRTKKQKMNKLYTDTKKMARKHQETQQANNTTGAK